MNFIKCAKCGREEPAFDYAHLCGPVEVKQTVMNERIKELAVQAGAQGIVNRDFIDVEKFANLIVQECIEVCGSVAAVRAGYNDADGRDTAYSCGDQIKEHFGVEL